MKKTLIQGALYCILLFLILFGLRMLYGYIKHPNNQTTTSGQIENWQQIPESRNYASKKMVYKNANSGSTSTVDQKYEKIGAITSKTTAFEEDEATLRAVIQSDNILVQYEQLSGLKYNRSLNVALGVIPEKFDAVIEKIQSIGTLGSIKIDKSDKTNEYKDLDAKKKSLVKARDALMALKGRGGEIDDLITLEDRILAIENEIQTYGVSLGEFDEENEFCTIKFTLTEVMQSSPIPLSHRIKVAFEWTVKYYIKLVIIVFLGSLSSLILVTTLKISKTLQKLLVSILRETKSVADLE